MERPADGGGLPTGSTLQPLLDLLVERIPAPTFDPDVPLQALVTNLDASPYVGRLALCRVRSGTLRKGRAVAWCRADGTIERARIAELYITDALDRVPAEEAGPGEIVAVAGIADITIGETLADPDDPRPLPVIHIDDPSLSMTVGINTSPLAGQEGTSMTARAGEEPPRRRAVGNVEHPRAADRAPRHVGGAGPRRAATRRARRDDAARGVRADVGKPRLLTREIDGVVHEPVDRLTVDVPEEFMGVITQLLALRKGRMEQIVNHGTGWVRLDYLVPARGLIGFRTELLTETRGTALLHHVFERYEPWAGAIRARTRGSLVADRRGPTTGYSLLSLQERGQLFVGPGVEVYEGMVVGENARADDMDINPTKEKKLTNIRSSTADAFEKLIPPRPMSLEQALEFIAEDECVEVTPRRCACARSSSTRPSAVELRNGRRPAPLFDPVEYVVLASPAPRTRTAGRTRLDRSGDVATVAAGAAAVGAGRGAVKDCLGRGDGHRRAVDRRRAVDEQAEPVGRRRREDERHDRVGGDVLLRVPADAVDHDTVTDHVRPHRQHVRLALLGHGDEVGVLELADLRRQLRHLDLHTHWCTISSLSSPAVAVPGRHQ